MSECVVREATESDTDALELVSQSAIATLRQTYRPTSKAIAQKQSTSSAWTQLVALLDKKAVGSVVYRIEAEGIHFSSLFVHQDYRRQGIGKRLVSELEQIGRRLGLQRLSAYAVKEAGTLQIFQRIGFSIISEEPTDLFESERFDQLTEVHIVKDIY